MGKRDYIGPRCKHLSILAERHISQALGDSDLTPAQSHIIKYLVCNRDNPPCQRDLEAFFSLSHPTVSGLLSRLEEKGYLTFQEDQADRRRKRIVATEKARVCAEDTRRVLESMEKRLLEGFAPEEQEAFKAYLDRAIKNLGTSQPGKEQA